MLIRLLDPSPRYARGQDDRGSDLGKLNEPSLLKSWRTLLFIPSALSVILTMSPEALTPSALRINQGEEEESRGRSVAREDDARC